MPRLESAKLVGKAAYTWSPSCYVPRTPIFPQADLSSLR